MEAKITVIRNKIDVQSEEEEDKKDFNAIWGINTERNIIKIKNLFNVLINPLNCMYLLIYEMNKYVIV